MVDRYVHGTVERISPEAPIPVVRYQAQRDVLGGAGNSAANVVALGAHVTLLTVCGQDDVADVCAGRCRALGITLRAITEKGRPTTLKTRVVGNHGYQMLRLDQEASHPVSPASQRRLVQLLRTGAARANAILVADYGKGVCTGSVLRAAREAADAQGVSLVIDPKPRRDLDLADLVGATVITPNLSEARQLLGDPSLSAHEAGAALSTAVRGAVLLTRGEDGLDLYVRGKRAFHADARSPDVADVSGAGDTVAAVMALCLASGCSLDRAADMANRAAGVVVRKHGTATLTLEELAACL